LCAAQTRLPGVWQNRPLGLAIRQEFDGDGMPDDMTSAPAVGPAPAAGRAAPASSNVLLSLIVAAAALVWHLLNGLAAALMGAFPASLDELQHLSFIRTMEAAPSLFPHYERMRVLDAATQRFTHAANYLYHPSPYYILMGSIDRVAHGSILDLRLVNLAVSAVAVVLMLAAGFRVLSGWKERWVFAAALVLFPKLGVVAGLINNDNAALLAAAVAFFGLIEWQRKPSGWTALILGIGLALCGWTKLTVLLMAGFATLFGEGLRWRAQGRLPPSRTYLPLAGGLAISAIPTVANLLAYGRVLPHSAALFVPPDLRSHLTLSRYILMFMQAMAAKWAALEPSTVIESVGLYAVLALAIVAVAVGLSRLRDKDAVIGAGWRVAIGLIAATLPVLALHLDFGWRAYVEDGFADMAQARYYYAVWPGFALGLALLWRTAPERLGRSAVAVMTATPLALSSLAFSALGLLIRGHTTIG
jgi:hypothetical protein